MSELYSPTAYVDPNIANVRRFRDLILYRVREILLVSSPYDAFILEEDGPLTEQVFMEYQELSLSAAPRFTHAPTTRSALKLLGERQFDLVLVMTGMAEMDVNRFGRKVKKLFPDLPVILLNLDQQEVSHLRTRIDPEAIERVFLWSGDSKILLAIIKYIEDRRNVDHDVKVGNVRVIIMIEDSVRHYSSFLRVLYRELMSLSRSLYAEGQSQLFRLMYMRSRPKILLATSYEEAKALFAKYKSNVFAVISDIGIPRKGNLDANAGLRFARFVRKTDPDLPILLQSSEVKKNREKALSLPAAFLDKNSLSHLADVTHFLEEQLGFGDFIFRTPKGSEVDRAGDLKELEEKLASIPEASLVYHAEHNHFSIWLMARSEFELAEHLRPIQISDFQSPEHCRQVVIQALRERSELSHRGVISDFYPYADHKSIFSRIGKGYLGGKARGIAFLNLLLSKTPALEWTGLPVRLPQTVVITTDEFDKFLTENKLSEFAVSCTDDQEIAYRFLAGTLSAELRADLRAIVKEFNGPLAVRSSSLLEDSLHQPFAGVYSTLMLPNRGKDLDRRHRILCNAVKLVYASTFYGEARSYLKRTGNSIEEEKMAVIIQRLIGRQHGDRFYPSFSGVAQSYNYYPIAPQKSEEGIVNVGLGLGRIVVDGGSALRFSPQHPQVLPQLSNLKAFLDSSQRGFWALDLTSSPRRNPADFDKTVRFYDLNIAETDGVLKVLGSVYNAEDNQIREDLSLPGPRLVSFANVLKHQAIPLPEAMLHTLKLAEAGLGCSVEIEFACEMGDWGRMPSRGELRQQPALYLLQVRPFAAKSVLPNLSEAVVEKDKILVSAGLALGNGLYRNIRDIIYVRPDLWKPANNKAIAAEVGRLNKQLSRKRRPYLLLGPGRWGTGDPWLGIPVQWGQISGARVVVEASPEGYNVDPSQGTHFFHNITSLGIGYLTLPPGASKNTGEEYVDWEWLEKQSTAGQTPHLRQLHFDEPLTVLLDGRQGLAMIVKPGEWSDRIAALAKQ